MLAILCACSRQQDTTGYLQSFQKPEVLKGSSLDNTDLVVLKVAIVTDTKERKRTMSAHILQKQKPKKRANVNLERMTVGTRGK